MKGLKRLGLAVAVATAVLAIAGFVAGSVMAVSGSISLSSGSAEPDGGTGTVNLTSNVGAPGLGAWTVDISYDTSVVSVSDCAPAQGGVCNPAFGDGVIRITGASATGLTGEKDLGTITFECADADGSTDLTMSLDVFADATIGNPTDISPATRNDGSFACEVQPTDAPDATATEAPDLPSTGTGVGDSSSTNWVIVAIVGIGLASLASLTAVRFGARRS
jgi:hypothetical protein